MDSENNAFSSGLDKKDEGEQENLTVLGEVKKDSTKGKYFERNYEKIKWSLGVYHIVFGIWAVIIFMKIFLINASSILYLTPLLAYIVCSILGGYKLIKNDRRSINILLVAQLPQIIVLQLNGFYYSMVAGQWITFTFLKKDVLHLGFNFGVLGSTYNLYLQSGLIENGFGINLVPIIAILILFQIEVNDFKNPL